jgi:Mn-dependent DtxR family transcriptional regulator
MTKQQLEILSLFEDCTKEINTLEIYKSVKPSYYELLDKLIKEGYLDYKTDNYLKMTGFGLSKFNNPKGYKLTLVKLDKSDPGLPIL